jgi:predicted heme/steroid binding protein
MEVDPPNLTDLLQQDFDKSHEDFDLVFYLIGFILILLVLWSAGLIGGEKPKVVDEDDKLRETPYTVNDIKRYDGKNDKTGNKTYIGLSGYVFDVSASPNFKEGGMYAAFAGQDISIACAHYSTEEKYIGMEYDRANAKLTFD